MRPLNLGCPVVLYRFSTSNHNQPLNPIFVTLLYYIVSLHQTTTVWDRWLGCSRCIISFLYIKPQPYVHLLACPCCCIISFLYIKPQLMPEQLQILQVVLYRFSTSNHNLGVGIGIVLGVVLYRFSTSNHNPCAER